MKKIYNLLFEQDESQTADTKDNAIQKPTEDNVQFKKRLGARKANDSVDDQIDSLLLMYEQKSIRKEEDMLMESLFKSSLRYLFEQDDSAAPPEEDSAAPPAEDDAATPEDSTSTSEPSGSEVSGEVPPAEKDLVPDLDIDKFTSRVARLVLNYRNLLRVEDAIINRAKNFLDENYGDAFVSRYMSSLTDKFGIEVSEFPDDEEVYPQNYAVGASGGGSTGG